ncbi:alpha beta hydrolase fold-3 domain containing protein [Diaporthe amygdali]|uniref:alpha beta hydrolase fold-3 domain containing protein n=1 Tax=Phomopsis amygdali TaxID=1214568 RepID=UPI0022FF2AFD|nr:alpha beta hydrolase fold-3 domain containing protein [Diaporthe amygdali]KAJ0116358.1 alpha beta hydrolase fold-3 domain containing protein [Diaporthe amygdali]
MAQEELRPSAARSPWRQLGHVSRVILIIVGLPYTLIAALICRPHPKWTFRQTLSARLIRKYSDAFGRAGVSANLTLDPRKQGERFQVVDPAQFSESFYQGPAVSSTVAPSKVGGTWYPKKPESLEGRIFLWNHGGAFVMGDSRELFCGFLAKVLLEHAGADAVFCLEYRLSGYAKNPFPAALQDMISAYAYLTETLKIPSTSITIGGDSAGANLCLAFLRYVEGHNTGIKPPSSAALVSPWVSPLESLSPTRTYQNEKAYSTDYLAMSSLQFGANAYAPSLEIDGSAIPYIEPLGHYFATSVPIFAHYGECEILGPGIVAWAEGMRDVSGNEVELFCEEDVPHDTIASGNLLGWEESAYGVGSKIGAFVRAHSKNTHT